MHMYTLTYYECLFYSQLFNATENNPSSTKLARFTAVSFPTYTRNMNMYVYDELKIYYELAVFSLFVFFVAAFFYKSVFEIDMEADPLYGGKRGNGCMY